MRHDQVRDWADAHEDQILEACQADDCRGFCIICDEEAHNVEPDARDYTCESCGAPAVYGAEGLLMHRPTMPGGRTTEHDNQESDDDV